MAWASMPLKPCAPVNRPHIAAIEGKASTQQAVMATMEAEKTLQAALAIRDKVVSAFLEISRMQI